MTTLEDDWRWYLATRDNLARMHRLARRHWAGLGWDGPLGRDREFSALTADDVQSETATGLAFLDDLAVVVLFSVFEQTVRTAVAEEVRADAVGLSHPVARRAVEDALRATEEGSFFRVLDPFKTQGVADLIEEVNQVRKYRNWVAHGRRGDQPPAVAPRAAYDRLSRFLAQVVADDDAELSEPPEPGEG